MSASVEFVKNSYVGRVGGSEKIGDVLSFFRNFAIDTIEASEIVKYNFINYASGNLNHPVSYEWSRKDSL